MFTKVRPASFSKTRSLFQRFLFAIAYRCENNFNGMKRVQHDWKIARKCRLNLVLQVSTQIDASLNISVCVKQFMMHTV